MGRREEKDTQAINIISDLHRHNSSKADQKLYKFATKAGNTGKSPPAPPPPPLALGNGNDGGRGGGKF